MFRKKEVFWEKIEETKELVLQLVKEIAELKKILTELQSAFSEKIKDLQQTVFQEMKASKEDLKETLQNFLSQKEKKERGVHLLVDGDNVLRKLFDLERRLDWKRLVEEVERTYGKIKALFFYAVSLPDTLAQVICVGAGFDIVNTSFGRPGIEDLTDLRILRYIENLTSGNLVVLFTEDRGLRRKATEIARTKGLTLVNLFFDPEYPHSVKDDLGNITIPLFLPRYISPEKEITPNIWEEAILRVLEGRLFDPEKSEIDHFLLAALSWLFLALPSSPRKEAQRIPRSFIHLAGELLSYLRAYQHFSAFPYFRLSEGDTIAILDALIKIGLIRKAKIGEKEVCYRAPHREWRSLKNWLPPISGEE